MYDFLIFSGPTVKMSLQGSNILSDPMTNLGNLTLLRNF